MVSDGDVDVDTRNTQELTFVLSEGVVKVMVTLPLAAMFTK